MKIRKLLKFQLVLILFVFQSKSSSLLQPVQPQNTDPPEYWKEDWHNQNSEPLTRVHLNVKDHVAIYFDSYVIGYILGEEKKSSITGYGAWFMQNPHWLFNFTSNVWTYMKRTYGEFGPDPYLYLVLHQRDARYVTLRYCSIYNKQKKNILDIRFPHSHSWESNLTRSDTMDLVINELAVFVEKSSKQHFKSPSLSYNVWKIPLDLDFTAWSDIFTFDVYKNLNLTYHAKRYKTKITGVVNLNRKTWFQDWFLPIYEFSKPGGNLLLNRYFEILSENNLLLSNVYGKSNSYFINKGGFVHFWSMAANADLKNLTREAFGWSDDNEREFVAARHLFPYKYSGELLTSTSAEEPKVITKEVVAQSGAVGGSVASAIIIFLILVLIASFIFYKKKIQTLQSEIRELTAQEVKDFFEGDGTVKEDEEEALVLLMPFIKDFEIPRDDMILDPTKVLGSGQFGTVIHGVLLQSETELLKTVAIKTVKPDVDVACFKVFLSEVKIMAYLGRHENIVDLLGTCTTNIKNREIFIALEFCRRGNLLDNLKNNRTNFQGTGTVISGRHPGVNKSADTTSGKQNIITNTDLIRWSHEVSNAMMYLTEKKVIHGDLAARNILLTENRTAKISDFGLSRQFLNYANYMKTSKIPVPWRWLAIESLKDMNFSTASDVWAFGVTMWEIFSLGEVPYGAWTYDLFFVDKLAAGDRLLIPTHATQSMYEMMKDCWQVEPSKRPKFQQIHNILGNMIATEFKNPYFKGNVNEKVRHVFNKTEMVSQL